MPAGTIGIASTGVSMIQPKNVTGVSATIPGAKVRIVPTAPSATSTAKEMIPSGSLRATKTRLFQVTGSRSTDLTRCQALRPVRHVRGRRDRDPQQAAGERALDPGHDPPAPPR